MLRNLSLIIILAIVLNFIPCYAANDILVHYNGNLELQIVRQNEIIPHEKIGEGIFKVLLKDAMRWGTIYVYLIDSNDNKELYSEIYFDSRTSPYQQIAINPSPIPNNNVNNSLNNTDKSKSLNENTITKLEFTVDKNFFYIYNPKKTKYNMDVKTLFNERQDRVLIPVRFFAESLGYKVDWDYKTNGVTITSASTAIYMQIGSNFLICNNKIIEMDEPLQEQNNRSYLPLRFVGEAFGFNVSWDYIKLMATLSK